MVFVGLLGCGTASPAFDRHIPTAGYVPDAATAARVAEAICIPIFGAEQVASEQPFKVVLARDRWVVTGKDLRVYR
jgi:hypothetical protein